MMVCGSPFQGLDGVLMSSSQGVALGFVGSPRWGWCAIIADALLW